MGIFAAQQLSKVQVFGSGKYFKPGDYLVRIHDTRYQKGYKGETVIIEAEILGVINDGDEADPVGTINTQVISLSGDQDKVAMGFSNLMGFACAAYEVENPEAYSSEEWDQILTETLTKNGLENIYMVLSCFNKMSKKEKEYTVHKWLGLATKEDFAKYGLDVPTDFE